jgi:hypothetical protein
VFGITSLERKSLEHQKAERNCVVHRFNKGKISFRTEVVLWFHEKAPSFSIQRVLNLFNVLEKLVNRNELVVTRVFNADEAVQKAARKVFTQK